MSLEHALDKGIPVQSWVKLRGNSIVSENDLTAAKIGISGNPGIFVCENDIEFYRQPITDPIDAGNLILQMTDAVMLTPLNILNSSASPFIIGSVLNQDVELIRNNVNMLSLKHLELTTAANKLTVPNALFTIDNTANNWRFNANGSFNSERTISQYLQVDAFGSAPDDSKSIFNFVNYDDAVSYADSANELTSEVDAIITGYRLNNNLRVTVTFDVKATKGATPAVISKEITALKGLLPADSFCAIPSEIDLATPRITYLVMKADNSDTTKVNLIMSSTPDGTGVVAAGAVIADALQSFEFSFII